MNYLKIKTGDIANGIGVRVSLWLSGCCHRCYGCQNPETWDINAGLAFDEEAKRKIYNELSKPYIQGLTISGGDPLFPDNRKDLLNFIFEVKKRFPDKDIWIWTGYTFEQLIEQDSKDPMHTVLTILKLSDVLIDGEFEISKKDITLEWRGSSNQRIIDLEQSIECYSPKLVLWRNGEYK